MSEAIINGIFTLVGVILGFGLSLLHLWRQDRQQAQAVRKLLATEINHNFVVLQVYWARIEEQAQAVLAQQSFPNAVLDGNYQEAYALSQSLQHLEHDRPQWQSTYFHNQPLLLATVLSKREFAAVHTFYTRLGDIHSAINKHVFIHVIPAEWIAACAVKEAVERVLHEGLPLRSSRS